MFYDRLHFIISVSFMSLMLHVSLSHKSFIISSVGLKHATTSIDGVISLLDFFAVIIPRGDSNIEVSSKPFPVYCRLNPEHEYYTTGLNSSRLRIYKSLTDGRRPLDSTVLNSTTIMATINPDTKREDFVECLIDVSQTRFASSQKQPEMKGICSQHFLIGRKTRERKKCILKSNQTLPYSKAPRTGELQLHLRQLDGPELHLGGATKPHPNEIRAHLRPAREIRRVRQDRTLRLLACAALKKTLSACSAFFSTINLSRSVVKSSLSFKFMHKRHRLSLQTERAFLLRRRDELARNFTLATLQCLHCECAPGIGLC